MISNRRSLVLAATVVAILAAAPAYADTASQRYADVPAGHWAEKAVTFVAVDRGFMRGFADGTFKGDQPFTRVQLAMAVDELIRQLERQTGVSWETEGLGGYEFQDLPADPEARDKVLKLANKYRLFEGVPGVTSKTFEGGKQVDRYEMAKVIHRLMRLGEDKKVVDASVLGPQTSTFSDLPRTAWAYNEVKAVADRYQVMIGFPDATFRGPEQLTRYEFAASAAQTFPLVVSLVDRTAERQNQNNASQRASGLRFQEDAPVVVAGGYQPTYGPGAMLRAVGYLGGVFGLAEAQGFFGSASGYGGTAAVGYAFPLTTGLHLQPYLGMRADAVSPGGYLGGLTYGALAYWRPTAAFGLHLRAAGTSVLGDSTGALQGSFLPAGSAGAWWHFAPKWSVFAEGGYGRGFGATTALTDAPYGLLGIGYDFK